MEGDEKIEYVNDIFRGIYFWITAIILVISLFISCGVVYIILTRSTVSLKVYRWYMLNSVILACINGVNIFMFLPIPLYPHFVFIVNGPAKYLPLGFIAVYQPLTLGWAFIAPTGVTLRFYYRYVKVCTHSWFHYALSNRWKSILIVTVSFLLMFSCFTGPLTWFQIPPHHVRDNLTLATSMIASFVDKEEILIGYDMPRKWFIFASGLFMLILSCLAAVIIYSTIESYRITKSKSLQSHRVNFLLRMFTDTVLTETVFAFCLYIPVAIVMVNFILFPRYFNYLLPLIIVMVQLYSIVEPLCVVFFVEPYRRASRYLLFSTKLQKPLKSNKIHVPSMNTRVN